MNQGKISVVIPVYNEEKNIESCLETLCGYMASHFEDYEVIIVNDGSTDSTERIFLESAGNYKNLRMISYTPNKGKGGAVRTGMLGTAGDRVVCTDCDLAYGVEVIGRMARELDSTDLVIGSRNLTKEGHKEYTLLRKLASKTYIKLVNFVAGFRHSDSQCGIKAYRGDAARRIFSYCEINSFAFDLEALMIAEKAGYTIGEYPVSIINHSNEGSKVRIIRDTKRMLSDLRRIKKRIRDLDLTKES